MVSPSSDGAMLNAEEELRKRFADEVDFMKEITEMCSQMKEASSVDKQGIYSRFAIMIKKFVENRYGAITRFEPPSSLADTCKLFLQLNIAYIESLNRFTRVPSELICFVISKILLSCTSPVVYQICGGTLQQHFYILIKYLQNEDRLEFVERIIRELDGLASGRRELCITTNGEFHTLVKMDSFGYEIIIIMLIELLQHMPNFEYKDLQQYNLYRLWNALLSSYLVENMQIRKISVQLCHRLLQQDLGNFMCWRILLSRVHQMELLMAKNKHLSLDVETVRGAHSSLLQELSSNLLYFHEHSSLNGIDISTVVQWAYYFASLCQDHYEEQKPEYLEKMIWCCCDVLSRYDGVFETESKFKELTELIQYFTVLELRSDTLNCRSKEKLIAYISYLLTVDDMFQTSDQFLKIKETIVGRSGSYLTLPILELTLLLTWNRIVMSILGKCKPQRARELLNSCFPNENLLFTLIQKAATEASEDLMLVIIQTAGDLANYSEESKELAVHYLVFPWLPYMPIADVKRKIHKVPVLIELKKISSKCSAILTDEVRESTLLPLTTLNKSSEWRAMIFTLALHSSSSAVKQTALKQVPVMIASCTSMFETMLPVFFDLKRDSYIIAPYLASISSSICAASGHYTRGFCTYCTSEKKAYPSENLLDISSRDFPRLLLVLQEIFADSSHFQVDVRHESVSLLLSILSHVNCPVGSLDSLLQASFSLCVDVDLEVRDEYRAAFELIIKHSLFVELSPGKLRALEAYKLEQVGKALAVSLAAASFLSVCIRFASSEVLREWAFAEHLSMILEFYDSDELKQSMRETIKSLAIKECSFNDGTVVFNRRIRKFSMILMADLLDCSKQMQMESSSEESIFQELDKILLLVSRMFDFHEIPKLLKVAAKYMVTELFRIGGRTPRAVTVIVKRMAIHLNVKICKLGYEVVPMLLTQGISTRVDINAKLVKYVFGLELDDCVFSRRYHCNLHILYILSLDQVTTLNILNEINKRVVTGPFTLTKMMNVNFEYLGLLLSYRRALLGDEFFEVRTLLLNSLKTLIALLDQEFVDEVSNKFMAVLRAATDLGEGAIPVWASFVRILHTRTLASLLPQILIAIQPLLKYPSTNDLLDLIFKYNRPRANELSKSFERTALVLMRSECDVGSKINSYLRQMVSDDSRERVISACVVMLTDECETVGKVVLEKLITILDGTPLSDGNLTKALVPALLHTLRKCGEPEVRSLAAACLARIGAVDPGRLLLESPTKNAQTNLVFVDCSTEFFVYLIERCWKVYSNVLDAQVIDQVELCLQELLKRLVGSQDVYGIMANLNPLCVRDIEPLCKSSLNPILVESTELVDLPFADHVDNFNDWLKQCFFCGTSAVGHQVMLAVFRALIWIVNTGDTVFTREVLPHMIIRLLIESNEDMLEMFFVEMQRVLCRVADGEAGWIQMAAHVVFSVIDYLERFVLYRIGKNDRTDQEALRADRFIQRIVDIKLENDSLLIVTAAEKCQCFHRALRWCEQYGIQKNTNGNCEPLRRDYYTLERINTHLHNIDGVLGAYEALAMKHTPTADERILALEANGDYHESLPLYPQSNDHKELKLIKCLLRLNQPELALSIAVAQYEKNIPDQDVITADALEASQLEAAWQLKDWSRVEKNLLTNDPLLSGKQHVSWGSACASIMNSLRCNDQSALDIRLKAARDNLVHYMTAMSIEQTDTYAQVYKYIAQLHILEEVEDAAQYLNLLGSHSEKSSKELHPLLLKWQARSDIAMQCSSILEPILRVRRELLLSCKISGSTKAVSQLYIQSCRLARQAGHLQIAWTFLVDAKALNVNHKEVGMEEARYEFQKGNQQQAIGLLTKLLNGKFADANELFSNYLAADTKSANTFPTDMVRNTAKDERTSFAEVHLLRAEYMMKAGAVSSNDLYKIYIGLTKLDVQSEDLFYRVAVFCDGMYSSDNPNIRSNMINQIVYIYGQVLKFGENHLFHAMPRMLTLWLDFTQKKTEEISRRKDSNQPNRNEVDTKDSNDIERLSKEVLEIYKQLTPQKFYTAFQQLISRIVHPSDRVFATLKIILADLLIKFPHQCLWQSISVYRTGPWKENLRQERCTQVFDVARRKNGSSSSLSDLILQYDYVAALLTSFGEARCAPGLCHDLPQKFPQLHRFFASGEMHTELLMNPRLKNEGSGTLSPTVMIPLTEMLELTLPLNACKVESLSQFDINDYASPDPNLDSLPREQVFIQSIENEYLVLKSMMRPKRLTLLATDGRKFQILCKPNDELRKDSRFMDVNRMMNNLMKQNADARRRQLMVRTFTVIPLQANGGILEWVPNLMPYREVLRPLCVEASGRELEEKHWFNVWPPKEESVEVKVAKLRSYFYENYPLVMAEWFRRQFTDAATWHIARNRFSRSTAVMSMIGFVLGLGDRHGENVLLDLNDGCLVHVDFNLIFNKGEQLPVKEVVPFRLTRNMINGMGPTGVEGVFRKASESTLRVMRDNRDTLLTLIHTFVHDPLLEWVNTGNKAQQNKMLRQVVKAPQAVDLANDAVSFIDKRLRGHIVTPDVFKSLFNTTPMSVEGQVGKLIEIASDERMLAQMYIGWAPFL